jgi:hypothetical protein
MNFSTLLAYSSWQSHRMRLCLLGERSAIHKLRTLAQNPAGENMFAYAAYFCEVYSGPKRVALYCAVPLERGEGSTSYSDCTAFTSGFSSATDIARMRILSLSGN